LLGIAIARFAAIPLFDKLKIDRSFIESIDACDASFPLLSSIRAMAENLGIDVVAEGIETDQQSEWLRTHGFEWGQGYFFGRPRPLSRAVEMGAGLEGTRSGQR